MKLIFHRNYYLEVELDLTGTCNLSCPLCSRNYTHAQHMVHKNIRPLDEIIEQLNTFPNIERAFVAGQVSEPTLYPDFLDYLRYLKSRNIYIELYTNGSTRDQKFWRTLSNILDEDDQVHFTICGSTQELHETYRVGSSLSKILENVKAFRSDKNNDYCQFIRFEYNKDDESNVKKIEFSNHYSVGTEGDRFYNEKVKDPKIGIKPEDTRDRLIKWIFNNPSNTGVIKCKSIEDKKIYIDQNGKISACYIHYEYNPEHVFDGDRFNYEGILNFKYDKCMLCEEKTRYKIEKLGLDFVC